MPREIWYLRVGILPQAQFNQTLIELRSGMFRLLKGWADAIIFFSRVCFWRI